MPRKKVLLVDDVHLIIELEKAFLKGLPVDILVANNGAEALEIAKREAPDLIYLDLNMPIMDGPACCRALKADPETRGIPVIMVTTAGRDEDQLLCRSAGCDDFVTKPINNKLFLEKGRACLADFERRRQRYSFTADVQFLINGEPGYGVVADISKGGIFIALPQYNLPDDPACLSFTLPVGGNNIFVTARGRVAWANEPETLKKPAFPAGVGIEFTDIDPTIMLLIETFLDEFIVKV